MMLNDMLLLTVAGLLLDCLPVTSEGAVATMPIDTAV